MNLFQKCDKLLLDMKHEKRQKIRQNRSEASDKGWHKIHSMVKCILKVFTGEKAI